MSKFHINKHGVPAPCRATKGNCPLGGNSGNENHFNTQEEAQEYADKMNEQEHGLIGGLPSHKEETLKTVDGFELKEGETVFRHKGSDDPEAIFGDDGEAYDYISDIVYDGEKDSEAVTNEIEEVTVTRQMVEDYQEQEAIKVRKRTEGDYDGNHYKTSQGARSAMYGSLNQNNVKEVLDEASFSGDIPLTYKTKSADNSPVEMDVNISKTGDDEYSVKGSIHEGSESGKRKSHKVDYKFTSEELRDSLVNSGRVSENPRQSSPAPAIFGEIYDMSRDKVK